MAYVELDPRSVAVMQALAGSYADQYIGEVLLPALARALRTESTQKSEIAKGFADPYLSLHAFYFHYAFSRRGKDREELAEFATLALKRCIKEHGFPSLLQMADGAVLWEKFDALCLEHGHKNSEQLNRGLIQGMLELAQEIYQIDEIGSIPGWIALGVRETGHIEPQFLRIVDIRGVGPKNTSTFLRDVAFVFDLEDDLDFANRLYVQPIDRWIRMIAEEVITEIDASEAADWIIAGKLAKYARYAGVSGIRFNMGATYFGVKEVRDPGRLESCLETLTSPNRVSISATEARPVEGHPM